MNERKIFAMHKRFGTCGVLRCRDCEHLMKNRPTNRVYYKCELYGDSNGEATDWRLSYQACGMYNVPQDMERWVPLLEQIRHQPRVIEQLDGQMSLDDFLGGKAGQA